MNKDKFREWAEYLLKQPHAVERLDGEIADFLQSLADLGDEPDEGRISTYSLGGPESSNKKIEYVKLTYADYYIKQLAATKLEMDEEKKKSAEFEEKRWRIYEVKEKLSLELDEAKRRIKELEKNKELLEAITANACKTANELHDKYEDADQPKQPPLTPEQFGKLMDVMHAWVNNYPTLGEHVAQASKLLCGS